MIIHQCAGGRSEKTQGRAEMAEWNPFIYICIRVLHSFLSLSLYRAASIVSPLLPKATLTSSIQLSLGLPLNHPLLTPFINILLAIRSHPFSPRAETISIFSDKLYSSCLWTSSFQTISIRDPPTKLLIHFISRTFIFLLSALLIPHASAPYNYSINLKLPHKITIINYKPVGTK